MIARKRKFGGAVRDKGQHGGVSTPASCAGDRILLDELSMDGCLAIVPYGQPKPRELGRSVLIRPDGRAKLMMIGDLLSARHGPKSDRAEEVKTVRHDGGDYVDEAFELLASIGCQVVHCQALPLGNSVNKRRLIRQR